MNSLPSSPTLSPSSPQPLGQPSGAPSVARRQAINPWQWQQALGYSQAVEIAHASHTLYCAGQAAIAADGTPSTGDMAQQLALALDNVEAVLTQAGYSLGDVVRINYFTTSVADFFQHYGEAVGRLARHQCQAASTLLEVTALAMPGLLVEVEVTAVR